MKIKLIITIILLFSTKIQAQVVHQFDTWKDFNLQGKVKSVMEQTVSPKKDKGEVFTMEFDSEGKIIEASRIYNKRKNKTIDTYLYDNQSRPQKKFHKKYVKKDIDNESVMSYQYSNDSVFVHIDFKDSKGETQVKEFTILMKDGLAIKYFGTKNGEYRVQEFTYDEHRNLVSEKKYTDGKFKSENVIRYKYDYEGRMIEVDFVEAENSILKLLPNGYAQSFGNYTYEYQYDEKGNYIKKTCYKDGKKYDEYIREIEYSKISLNLTRTHYKQKAKTYQVLAVFLAVIIIII